MTEEIPLPFGDVTEGVVRVGQTVRRPVGRHSPLVHDVLNFLERQGFDGAPRFLGIDHLGRETLTFVEGESAGRPWPGWVADESKLVSVARLVRRMDDLMQGLGIPESFVPEPEPEGAPASIDTDARFIAHLDVTPENVVLRGGEAYALIDFDLAGASSRALSLLSVLQWWAQLCPPQDRDPVMAGLDPLRRARLAVDAYGLPASQREHLVDLAINQADRTWFLMRDRASRIGGGWDRMWRAGVGDIVLRRAAWLRSVEQQLKSALTEPPLDPDPVVVAAVACWRDPHHLLTVRKRGTSRFMLPGGKVEQGETFPRCAARELLEEVGVRAQRLDPLGTWIEPAANEPGLMVEATMFDAGITGQPAAPAAEIAELRWLDTRLPPPADSAPLLVAALPMLTQRRTTDV